MMTLIRKGTVLWAALLAIALAGALACGTDEPADTGPSAAEIEQIVKSAVGDQLTADDVQRIVDASAGSQLSADDVQRIVDASTGGQLTAADVQRIVDASAGSQLSADDVQKIVDASAAGQLTADDVQKIVDESSAGQLTADDVEKIVSESVAGQLTADDVQKIVDASAGEQLTAADVQEIVQDSTGGQLTAADVEKIVDASAAGQLTTADVQRIISESVSAAVDEARKATAAAEAAAMDASRALAAVQPTAVPAPSSTSVLRVGNSNEVQYLDAAKSQSGTDIIFSELIYNRLLQYDATMMDPKPDVASSWRVSADGLTYVFTLREDVTFHNGKGVTAHDVEYSWDRCRLEILDRGRCRGELNDVVSYEATGDYEFTVVLNKPSPVFLPSMAHWSLAIVDEGSTDTQDTHPIGTGPYKFVEQVPGDKLVLEKYDEYFDQDILNLRPERVFIIPMTDPQTRMAAVRAGEIDFAVDVPLEQVASIATTEGVQLLQQVDGITASYMTVIFNVREGPMTDLNVRKAVQLAVDPDAINRAIFFGLGEVSCNPILESHWAYLPFECPERDIEKAKDLLAESGYGPENPLQLKYYPENLPVTQKMAEVIQQNLADAGIEMEIVIVDSPTWLDKVWFGVDCDTGDWPESRCWAGTHKEYDLGDAWYTREPDPDGLMQSVLRADSHTSGFKGNNGMRYYNPEIERLFDEAKSTTDRAVRAEAYRQIVDIMVNQDVPLIKLQSMPRYFAAGQAVQGGYVNPKGYWNAKDWTFQE